MAANRVVSLAPHTGQRRREHGSAACRGAATVAANKAEAKRARTGSFFSFFDDALAIIASLLRGGAAAGAVPGRGRGRPCFGDSALSVPARPSPWTHSNPFAHLTPRAVTIACGSAATHRTNFSPRDPPGESATSKHLEPCGPTTCWLPCNVVISPVKSPVTMPMVVDE